MAIRAIIFDLEGVLMTTREKDFPMSLAKALQAPYDAVYDFFHGEMNDKVDRGDITQDEFNRSLIQTLGLGDECISTIKQVIDENCFIDQKIVARIIELKPKFKIGLLSNYSKLMRDKIENDWHIKHLFDDIIISYEVGLIKPDPAIFALAISRLGAARDETVLVDDRLKNIKGAREFGMHAIHYQNNRDGLNALDQLIQRLT